jgi:glycerol-3-phosphate acyltransferase PlsY
MGSIGQHIFVGLTGYLIGSFPTGVVFSQKRFGIDVREIGSGNIGATNVTRVFGWFAGAIVFVIDILKGFLPVALVDHYFANSWLTVTVGICSVLGHCCSVFLKFRGGKGVATGFGCLLWFEPTAAAVSAAIYIAALGFTRISAVGSLSGLGVLLIYLLVRGVPTPTSVLFFGVAAIVIFRHKSNIARLLRSGIQKKS